VYHIILNTMFSALIPNPILSTIGFPRCNGDREQVLVVAICCPIAALHPVLFDILSCPESV
jgi:hypothetical protein